MARAQYRTGIAELDAAKQELRKIRQDYDLSTETKFFLPTSRKPKLKMMQKGAEGRVESRTIWTIETQLAETMNEIEALQKQMENAKVSDLDSGRTVTSELNDAKESLRKEKEAEIESIAGNLNVKRWKSKAELESCLAEESKAREAGAKITVSREDFESSSCKVEESDTLSDSISCGKSRVGGVGYIIFAKDRLVQIQEIDTFVEVLVKDGEWLPGTPETLKGLLCSCMFSWIPRSPLVGVCGPALVGRSRNEME
ncbi:hypothetical protein FEM48_Zijuj10G0034800 [Ziziphus jujuba var. spinosa]|uniref:Uncharacterized protein n=1 Tax=Ziziphus jujuba var. spinosa TaxID=714518 RepID=A0A978UL13_ZIZJJ|nr:hypothetical protein FEM48_Zijuj10G0034800 [Ziziphus jujuba var. spinosa]